MLNRNFISFFGVFGLIISGTALGATPTGSSVSKPPRLIDNLMISGYSEFTAARVRLNESSGMGESYNIFTFGWKLGENTSVIFQERFNFNFSNADFTQLDVRVGPRFTKVLSAGRYSISDVRAQLELPTSSLSQSAGTGKYFALRTTLSQSYDIGRWSAGLDFFSRFHFYKQADLSAETPDFDIIISPSVSYQLSPRLSTQVLYNIGTAYSRDASFFKAGRIAFTESANEIYTYLRWQALPALEVAPFIRVDTGLVRTQGTDATKIGFELAGSIL